MASGSAAGPAPAVDVPALLAGLVDRGVLSSARVPGCLAEPETVDILRFALAANTVRCVHRVDAAVPVTTAYDAVREALGPERLLWHGTLWDSVTNIACNGFNRVYSGRHGSKLGRGTYFAEDAAYALRFCGPRKLPSRALFLAKVLPGRVCRGTTGLVEPPVLCERSGVRYDSTVDDPDRPGVFCVFRDYQALPLYLVEVV